MAISLLISKASAIVISEVELNPSGNDAGHEWVELYSSSEYNLDNHYLINHDGGTFNLSGAFTGYKVITFTKQFLDNSNESIALMVWGSNSTIDSTGVLKDDKNNDFTWSLCDGELKFVNSSKGAESSCTTSSSSPSPSPAPDTQSSSQTPNQSTQPSTQSTQSTQPYQPMLANDDEPDRIVLSKPKNQSVSVKNQTSQKNQTQSQEPINFITKQEKIRLWIAYSFSFLCLVVIILLLWKKL